MLERIRKKGIHPGPEGKAQLLLLGALFLGCLFIFRDYIFGNEVMVFNDIGEDTWQLYTMQYASIVNHLREGTFSLWDFTNGFGTNQFNMNLFDPSLMLLYALGVVLGPAHMLLYLVWIQVIKILAAGFVFYKFLSLFSFSRQGRVLMAFAYGFNGYLLVWGQHYQFGMVTVYFPLLLLFAEKFLRREKGCVWFAVTAFLCGIYSVYFTYMCFAALGVYLLFRVYMMEGLTVKERLLRFLGACAQMLLGLGMSFVVFLPMASVLLNVSSRLGQESTGLLDTLKSWFGLYPREFYESVLMRLFSTNLQTVHSLGDGSFDVIWNYYEDPIFFCSTLSVFLNLQFLAVFWRTQAPKRTKRAVYAGALLILAAVLLQVGGVVFNAFTLPATNRYTFVLTPFFLLAAAWMWDYIRGSGKLNGIVLVIGFLAMNFAYRTGYGQSVFREYRVNASVLAVTGEVMVLCLGALMVLKGESSRKLLLGLLCGALVINVLSESQTTYEDRISLRKEDTPTEELEEQLALYNEQNSSLDSEEVARASLMIPQTYFRELYRQDIQDALAYLEENDKEFYRVEKDFMSATWAMDSLAQGYRGISTYNSVMNKYVKDFVNTCYPELYYKDQNHYTFWDNAGDNWFAALTGVRYLLSLDEDLDGEKYTLLGQFGNVYLYQNTMAADVGKFFDTAVSEETFKEACTEETREELLGSVIVLEDGEDASDILEVLDTAEKDVSEAQDAWGADAQELSALAGTGAQVSPAVESSSVILDAPQKDSYLTGTVSAAADGYVLFMIPYEDGWSLCVDGEETELLRGDIGFLACQVSAGEHEITLSFHAPMLKEGAVLSVFFWLLFAAWAVYSWKKSRSR